MSGEVDFCGRRQTLSGQSPAYLVIVHFGGKLDIFGGEKLGKLDIFGGEKLRKMDIFCGEKLRQLDIFGGEKLSQKSCSWATNMGWCPVNRRIWGIN